MASKPIMLSPRPASVADLIGIDAGELETAFVCEEWRAELATGLVHLGPETAALHDLSGTRCGIMDLIQFYEPADWQKVLLALEEASTVSTIFSFATAIRPGPGLYRPVFCFGRSDLEGVAGGVLFGTFAIARLCLETASGRHGMVN